MKQSKKIHVHGAGVGHKPKDFLPLGGVLLVVCVLTYISVAQGDQIGMLAFMGWFFIIFGGLKALKLKDFVTAYREYDIIAQKNRLYGYAYPFLELAFGIAYLTAWQIERVSVIVFIIMLVSAWGVYLKLRTKEEIPCACLGTVFKVPMTWVTLGEDMLMAIMAFILFV